MNLTVEYFYNKYYSNTFGAEHIGNTSLYEVKWEYFRELQPVMSKLGMINKRLPKSHYYKMYS